MSKPRLRDHAVSALYAWIGDHLASTGNGLHQAMAFFIDNHAVAPEDLPVPVNGKVCVLLHGLGCNEGLWSYPRAYGEGDYGSSLEEEFGYQPLYIRYNTGVRIAENGAHLDALLRDYVKVHGEALKELLLIGHSMGGLVIRSACHRGREQRWVDRIDHIFYLGSPHLGAPLEKVANVVTSVLGGVDTTATRVISDLLKTRSRGVKDLRYGTLLDQEGWDHDPDELLRDRRVKVPWLSTARHHRLVGHAVPGVGALGDAVVLPKSASAARQGERPSAPSAEDIQVMKGLDHLALARHPAVYEAIARRLSEHEE